MTFVKILGPRPKAFLSVCGGVQDRTPVRADKIKVLHPQSGSFVTRKLLLVVADLEVQRTSYD